MFHAPGGRFQGKISVASAMAGCGVGGWGGVADHMQPIAAVMVAEVRTTRKCHDGQSYTLNII